MLGSISVSVRQMIEFVMRRGSIDSRFAGSGRAVEGTRIHRKLQKAGGENYKAEVPLSFEYNCDNYTLLISGQTDGIITDDAGRVTIDEIKTTGTPLESIDADFDELHWAQGMCYGYIYGVQNGLASVCIRLTYYHRDTDMIKRFEHLLKIEELGRFFIDLVKKYRIWTDLQQQWILVRDLSIKGSDFPFPAYRKGQRPLAASVYRTVCSGGKLFCQAPTGIGKTVSVLFPAIKALGEGQCDKIFYLTSTTITRQTAENTCDLLRDSGMRLKSVTLTAKDKICFLERRNCDPFTCTYANGHYDRINEALLSLLKKHEKFTREVIEDCARQYRVCPFELSLDLTDWSDCVIGDYNYVFDPRVYLRRFFTEYTGDHVFLIDEAHDLADRARKMYSAQLQKSAFLQMYKRLDKKDKIRKTIFIINKAMISMRKDCGKEPYYKKQDPYDAFQILLMSFISECEQWMKEHFDMPQNEQMLNIYFDVLIFLKIAEFFDERYVTLVEANRSEVLIRQFCLHPSHLLNEAMKKGKASVLFSATLTPMEYFISVLGGDETSNRLMLPSPFPRGNLCLLISDSISTKYKDREKSLLPVAEHIAKTAECRTGNYIAYFPSYAYMQAVYEVFSENHPEYRTTIQIAHMDEPEREAFLRQFRADNSETLIGFCVLGGIYSESIDLVGDRLIGTMIAGVGLPQLSLEQDIIRDFYDRKNRSGFEYAYQYPGMNKVMQAAGRVIRSDTDKGVVVLIDSRFTTKTYLKLFPLHWSGYQHVCSGSELCKKVRSFWKNSIGTGD